MSFACLSAASSVMRRARESMYSSVSLPSAFDSDDEGWPGCATRSTDEAVAYSFSLASRIDCWVASIRSWIQSEARRAASTRFDSERST